MIGSELAQRREIVSSSRRTTGQVQGAGSSTAAAFGLPSIGNRKCCSWTSSSGGGGGTSWIGWCASTGIELWRINSSAVLAEAAAAQQHRPVEVLRLDPLGDRLGLRDAVHQRGVHHPVPAQPTSCAGAVGSSASSRSTAAWPSRVLRYRSKALGAPPRWTCPRMVIRASSPSCVLQHRLDLVRGDRVAAASPARPRRR